MLLKFLDFKYSSILILIKGIFAPMKILLNLNFLSFLTYAPFETSHIYYKFEYYSYSKYLINNIQEEFSVFLIYFLVVD